MKRKLTFKKIFKSFLIPVILLSFRPDAFAKTILFDGDFLSIDSVIYSDNFEKKDLLLQLEDKEDFDIWDLSFLFNDSVYADLAIRVNAFKKWKVLLETIENSEESENESEGASWKNKFIITSPALYEFYIESDIITADDLKKCSLEVDGKSLSNEFSGVKSSKYLKVGEKRLEKGKHSLEFFVNLVGKDFSKEDLYLVLVEKDKRISSENEILNKINFGVDRVSYLFEKNRSIFNFPALTNGELKPFNLKLFLKPKTIPQNTRIENEEIFKEWKVMPNGTDNLGPLIVNMENFYPEDDIYVDFLGLYWWGKKDMRVNVFNPNDHIVSADFEFAVHSLGKERSLKIFLNDHLVDKVRVPLGKDFTKVKVEVLLNPGANRISFSCPLWKRSYMSKASVGFKDFRFTGWKLMDQGVRRGVSVFDKNAIFVPQDGFLDILFKSGNNVLLSRDIDVNLEDNPILVINGELQDRHAAQLFIYLGVDYNNDNVIDGYLRLKDSGDFNILDLVKKEWPQIREDDRNICRLKKIFILIVSGKIKPESEKKSVFRLQGMNFVQKKSLKLLDKQFSSEKVIVSNKNSKNITLNKGEFINILGYFDPKSENPNDPFASEITCFIPRDDKAVKEFPLFSFHYKIGLPEEQVIELFIAAEDINSGKPLRIPLTTLKQFSGEAEIKLTDFIKDNLRINGLLFSLRRQGTTRENVDWYEFEIADFKFSNILTYSAENKEVEGRINSYVNTINPGLAKIDSQIFNFNDFNFNQRSSLGDGYILQKEVYLSGIEHSFEKMENGTFDLEWAILEPKLEKDSLSQVSDKARVSFVKVNPTKYIVDVKGAKDPFWIIFNENFSAKWSLYQGEKDEVGVADNQHYIEKYTIGDIKYVLRKPLQANHRIVNGYANGWYIDPKKLGFPEDFTLVIYYSSQSGIYLSFIISGISILIGIIYLLMRQKKYEK